MDVAAALRRLLVDHRLDAQRGVVVQHQPTHVQVEEHIEEAVRVARCERVQVQKTRVVVHLLLDLTRRHPVRIQGQVHRAVRQLQGGQLCLHLVTAVAVVVVRHALRALEEHVRHRRAAQDVHAHVARRVGDLHQRRGLLHHVTLDEAREVLRVHDEHARRIAGSVIQLNRLVRDHVDVAAALRRLLVDHRLDAQRALVVKHRPVGQHDLEEHVEEAVGVAGVERIQIQAAGVVVDAFLDPAHRPCKRALGGVAQAQHQAAAAEVQRHQFRDHLVQAVQIIILRISLAVAVHEDMGLRTPPQDEGLRHGTERPALQLHEGRRLLHEVALDHRVRLVHLAHHEDPRALARLRIDQLHRLCERVDITLPVLRRLVAQRRLQAKRLRRHECLAADRNHRPDVEEAVGHQIRPAIERRDVKRSR